MLRVMTEDIDDCSESENSPKPYAAAKVSINQSINQSISQSVSQSALSSAKKNLRSTVIDVYSRIKQTCL